MLVRRPCQAEPRTRKAFPSRCTSLPRVNVAVEPMSGAGVAAPAESVSVARAGDFTSPQGSEKPIDGGVGALRAAVAPAAGEPRVAWVKAAVRASVICAVVGVALVLWAQFTFGPAWATKFLHA